MSNTDLPDFVVQAGLTEAGFVLLTQFEIEPKLRML